MALQPISLFMLLPSLSVVFTYGLHSSNQTFYIFFAGVCRASKKSNEKKKEKCCYLVYYIALAAFSGVGKGEGGRLK